VVLSFLILSVLGLLLLVRQRLAGHAVFTFDPFTEVDKLAPFGTEGTERIIFPFD